MYAPNSKEQHDLTNDSVHQRVSEPLTISKHSSKMPDITDSTVISEQTVSYAQPNTSEMENDASYQQTEKRLIDSSTVCENPNKKSKLKKSTNIVNNKKSLSTEEKETLLAQKFYITSLENRINDLQNTVSVLNGIKDSNVQSPQNESQRATGTIPNLNYEMSGEYTLRAVENKLNVFEANVKNALNLQNQLNLQNFMNIQNHLSIMSMQSQISSVQSQIQNVCGPQLQRYSNPMPLINPGLQQPMGIYPHPVNGIYPMQPITTVRPPSFVPTPITVPPLPYPHVLQTGVPVPGAAVPTAYVPMPPGARILQQPNMTMPPHLIQPQQQTTTFSQRPPTLQAQMQFQQGSGVEQLQPTSVQVRDPCQKNHSKKLVAEEFEQTVSLDDESVSDGESNLYEVLGQDIESQSAVKVQKTTVVNEYDDKVPKIIASDSGSNSISEENCSNKTISNTSKDTENIKLAVHDVTHLGDLHGKKHFLEIPSPKEIPPDVERLNAVVCSVQDRT